MKCSIVNRNSTGILLMRLEAENPEEAEVVHELQALDRSDELSPIASFGGWMVEVKVPRLLPEGDPVR